MKCEKKFVDVKNELENTTFAKTVLMLLVVFYHCIVFWRGDWFMGDPVISSKFLAVLSDWLNSFNIYAFALISGYLFYFNKYEQGKYRKFLPFTVTKAKRLLIPYAFVAAVWVIPIQYFFFRYDFETIVKNFVFAMNPNQLWFLWMLFGVSIVFWLLSDFLVKHEILGTVTMLGIFGIGLVCGMRLPNVFMIWRVCTYLPLFWCGVKIRQHGSGFLRKIPSLLYLPVQAALFFLTRWLTENDPSPFNILYHGFTFALHICGAVSVFVILQDIADKINWKKNKIFVFLAKLSMPIYLIHQQIIYFFIVCLNGVIHPFLHVGVNFICVLSISVIVSALLMKWKITRFLIG